MQNDVRIKFENCLRNNEQKITSVRTAVFGVLYDAECPLLPQQIVQKLPTVNQSSVYRTLDLFVRCEMARRVPRGFKTLYELGEVFSRHHHHVVCECCGRSVAVRDELIEQIIRRMTVEAGMTPTGHYIELMGVCRECQRLRRRR
jgi:Fur family ferric uptake transcriptional regulator